MKLFTEMMRYLFLSNSPTGDADFNNALSLLNNKDVNIHDEDEQLFRELYVGRFTPKRTLAIYDALIKRNYVMTSRDITNIASLFGL
jgi:hypothetical protein